MRTAAVLPVKSFDRAKQRLEGAVEGPSRRELVQGMVGDVLEALGRVAGLDDLVVVTAEPVAAATAEEAGAVVVHDPRETGQSSAAALGVERARERAAERVVLVPGDCPALDPEEVGALLDRHARLAAGGEGRSARPAVLIVPDRHGSGTNALVLSPPDALPPAFGVGSFARHAARAHAAGAVVRAGVAPSLALDVDTPGDLLALREALAARPRAAPRTRAMLERVLTAGHT